MGACADWLPQHCWYFDTESPRHRTVVLTANPLGLTSGDTTAFLATLSSLALRGLGGGQVSGGAE